MIEEFCEGIDFSIPSTFYVGFINPNIENYQGDGVANDETIFNAESLEDLIEIYEAFCAENGFPVDTVKYVEVVNESEN